MRRGVKGLGHTVGYSAAVFGASLILFSASKIFWLSVVLLVPVGYGVDCLQMSGSNTLIQSMVPDKLRGRAMAVYTMMFMGDGAAGIAAGGSAGGPDRRAVDGGDRWSGRNTGVL